jgi:hypothetical protein
MIRRRRHRRGESRGEVPRIVPKKYTQLALSIETLLDFSELMVKVTGCLKAVDHRE